MKRGTPYLKAVKDGMREGKTNSEARKVRKYNQKSGETSRIDLAPMVDIAFLLLTFFIMTTSFSKPKVFSMGLPQTESGGRGSSNQKPEIVTLKISESGNIFVTEGEDGPKASMARIAFSDIQKKAVEYKESKGLLLVIVKISSKVDFGKVIDILDEIYRGGVTEWATLMLTPTEEVAVNRKEKS